MKIIVFDTETTGLPKSRNASPRMSHLYPYIVQISWLTYDDCSQKISNINDFIIKLPDGMCIPEESTKIHGITNEIMQQKGVPIGDVLRKFIKDFTSSQIVAAHNIDFDNSIIQAEMYRNNMGNYIEKTSNIKYCTMKYGKPLTNILRPSKYNSGTYQKPPKLMELHEFLFQTVPNNLHNSMIDVWVCFRCLYKMIYGEDLLEKSEEIKTYFNKLCSL